MKKRMIAKRWVASLIVLMMIVGLTACGNNDTPVNTTGTQGTTISVNTDPSDPVVTEPLDTSEATEPVEETVEAPTADPDKETLTGYEYEITPIPGAVTASTRVEASYFDDAVFVGDSVSLKLNYYAAASGALGNAKFLTAGSLGSGNALWNVSSDSVHPVYNGEKRLIEDSIASMQADKVYIMLGMNDLAIYGVDGAVENLVKLIGRIQANAPEAKIIVQSMTPMTSTSTLLSSVGHTPQRIHEYNLKLMEVCKENGWYFLNVASVMYNTNGFLRRDYCSDPDGMGVHFTNAGCAAWVDYLSTHPIK